MSISNMSADTSSLIKDPSAHKLIELFELGEYFPSKITIQTARRRMKRYVNEDRDVPWYFIGKVLSVLDQEGWYDFDISTKEHKEMPTCKLCSPEIKEQRKNAAHKLHFQ